MTTMTAMRGTTAARKFDQLVAEADTPTLRRFLVLARRCLSRTANPATADAIVAVRAELETRS
jgi:hypothetical protein